MLNIKVLDNPKVRVPFRDLREHRFFINIKGLTNHHTDSVVGVGFPFEVVQVTKEGPNQCLYFRSILEAKLRIFFRRLS